MNFLKRSLVSVGAGVRGRIRLSKKSIKSAIREPKSTLEGVEL